MRAQFMPIAKISATALVVHNRASRALTTPPALIARRAAFWARWTTPTRVTRILNAQRSMAIARALMAIAKPPFPEQARTRVTQMAEAEATIAGAIQAARRRSIVSHVRRASHVQPVRRVQPLRRVHQVKLDRHASRGRHAHLH